MSDVRESDHGLAERWAMIEALEDDWDSHGSPAPTADVIARAKRLAERITGEVHIVPIPGGGIAVDLENDTGLVVEVLPDGDEVLRSSPPVTEGQQVCGQDANGVWHWVTIQHVRSLQPTGER